MLRLHKPGKLEKERFTRKSGKQIVNVTVRVLNATKSIEQKKTECVGLLSVLRELRHHEHPALETEKQTIMKNDICFQCPIKTSTRQGAQIIRISKIRMNANLYANTEL